MPFDDEAPLLVRARRTFETLETVMRFELTQARACSKRSLRASLSLGSARPWLCWFPLLLNLILIFNCHCVLNDFRAVVNHKELRQNSICNLMMSASSSMRALARRFLMSLRTLRMWRGQKRNPERGVHDLLQRASTTRNKCPSAGFSASSQVANLRSRTNPADSGNCDACSGTNDTHRTI